MWILIITLILLGIVAMMVKLFRAKKSQTQIKKDELDHISEIEKVNAECCGLHEVCKRKNLLTAINQKIEYYDDEELDDFVGRKGDEYIEEEIDMFREILYTTRVEEVAGWTRSLQQRGIELPDELKDEIFLIIEEQRANNEKHNHL